MRLVFFLLACLAVAQLAVTDGIQYSEGASYEWDTFLRDGRSIVANGNVWPPPSNDSDGNCILLLTHTKIMRHCPEESPDGNVGEDGHTTVIYREDDQRFRGAFSAPGTDRRRLWLLTSPTLPESGYKHADFLVELDTMDGKIVQTVKIPICLDGHDAVRVGNRVFIVDTRHGQVLELALPASAEPYTLSSVEAGAEKVDEKTGVARLVKAHQGFTRADHINNVAVHDDLLVSSLHGGAGLKRSLANREASPTRLTALARAIPEDEGRELTAELDGFVPVDNVGTYCHGIAFWEDVATGDEEGAGSKIKLISLDSKNGALVSVVLSGPGAEKREREYLWKPDPSHPVLTPAPGTDPDYKGTFFFSKGLTVQGGVAYFGVSYARSPKQRKYIPYSLLVAVDLASQKQLWARTIESAGMIHQVVSESYLGYQFLLPEKEAMSLEDQLAHENAMIAHKYTIAVTRMFAQTKENVCYDEEGNTLRLPIDQVKKPWHNIPVTKRLRLDMDNIALGICSVDVGPIRNELVKQGESAFSKEGQRSNARFVNRNNILAKFKPGVANLHLVFSSRDGKHVYHFPWLDHWLPIIQDTVLTPLRIDLDKIVRMQMANMTIGSEINIHSDRGPWVANTHRLHVPITTHSGVYFLAKYDTDDPKKFLRIKTNPGEVFEFNNAVGHAVMNTGDNRVHLIIDWADTPAESTIKLKPGETCWYRSNSPFACDNGKEAADNVSSL